MKNLDSNGNITTGSTISTFGRVELRNIIFNALNQNEYQFSWTQDKALLSFAADGTPVFSSLLTEGERTQLRLDEIPSLEVPEEMKPFLLWHRKYLLK